MNIETRLKAAVAASARRGISPIGAWRVETDDETVFLIWECAESDWPEEEFIVRNWPEEACGDEPWSDWGGDAIIATAGIGEPDDAGIDQDGGSVTHWAMWKRT